MRLVDFFRGISRNLASSVELLRAVVAGIDNGARLVHDKLEAVIAGIENHSQLVNSKFQDLPTKTELDRIEAIISKSISEIRLENAERMNSLLQLLNAKLASVDEHLWLSASKSAETVKGLSNLSQLLNVKMGSVDEHLWLSASKSAETVHGLNNLSQLLNVKLESVDEHLWLSASRSAEIVRGIDNQARRSDDSSKQVVAGLNNLSRLLNVKLGSISEDASLNARRSAEIASAMGSHSRLTHEIAKQVVIGMNNLSQLINNKLGAEPAPKITALPDLEKDLAALQQFAEFASEQNSVVPSAVKKREPASVSQPERMSPGEFSDLDRPSQNAALSKLSYFRTGDRIEHDAWQKILQNALEEVSSLPDTGAVVQSLAAAQPSQAEHRVNDAAFLFWLIRRLKPRDIVQVAEGGELSTLLMLLALTKNGSHGQLHLLGDSAAEPKNDQEGRWIFPKLYGSKLRIHTGNPNMLVPQIASQLEAVDVFYGCGRTQASIMLQLRQIRDKLSDGGMMIAEGPSGIVSIRDFAGKHGVPSLDLNGSLGVAFF